MSKNALNYHNNQLCLDNNSHKTNHKNNLYLLLVNPLAPSGGVYVNPLGLQTLQSYIESRDKSTKVALFDFNIKEATREAFIELIKEQDIIGFSTPFGSLPHLKKLLLYDDQIQQILKEKYIILGGNIATSASEDIFHLFNKGIFKLYILKGEGEIPLLKFIRCIRGELEFPEVSGLVWMNEDILIENPYAIEELSGFHEPPVFTDEILAATRDGGGVLFIEGLRRGCEHHCTFCYLHALRVSRVSDVRYFPINRIIETIKLVDAKGFCGLNIQFTDENFFGGRTRKEMCYQMKQTLKFANYLGQIHSSIHFGIDIRADSLFNLNDTDELRTLRQNVWDTLVKSGLVYVYIGVEAFNLTQLKRYNKNLDILTIEKSIEQLQRLGIRFTVGLITFDPLMTLEELNENIRFIEEHDLLGCISSITKEIRIQKGTSYYELASRNGVGLILNQDDMVFYDYRAEDYVDCRVGKIVSIMRRFYKLFNENNYRFADVPAFLETLRNSPDEDIKVKKELLLIPKKVAEIEFKLIKYLVSTLGDENHNINYKIIVSICNQQIGSISLLLDMAVTSPTIPKEQYSILTKLQDIFRGISKDLEQEAW